MRNDPVNCLLMAMTLLILFQFGCREHADENLLVKLNRSVKHSDYFEAKFSLENEEYSVSIWDRDTNNRFQDKGMDVLTLTHKRNNLFFSNILRDTCSLIINSRSYLYNSINDSTIQFIAIRKDSLPTPDSWILNDTLSDLVLYHYNSDSTSRLFEVIEKSASDSILIYIWETGCPPCIRDIGRFSQMESGKLKIIHLSLSNNAIDAGEYMSKKSYRPFFDGYIDIADKSKLYCIGFPTKFYVNRNKYITKYFF